jgi:TonB family protein
LGKVTSGPVLIYRVTAEYTEEARMAKIEGTVRIDLVIDEKGIPADLKLVRSLDKGLDAKALEAVKRWRFKPGLKDGNPVSSTATVGIVFRLPESRSN